MLYCRPRRWANEAALSLVQALRIQGFKAERDYLGRKLKAQFKSADVFAAKTLITLGSSEVESGQVTVKNNQTRQEVTVALESLKKDFPSVLAELGLAWSNGKDKGKQDLSGSRGKMVAPALFYLDSVCRPLQDLAKSR